ncbi:hypothetical protein CI109_103180 [Kwoniella shandongensis]|uniref:Uncharacterized protein n=1 Tax=Kwoniella shandongensis TaxID=1734106 RepID=A0A5M6CEG8_9TREE|nr:uncharacterized protein CI109_000371 [Kwoniella shandongensis]KAA5531529.1 hypothetical protein CI109_000371 [Kwoniella shandongensis]
MTEYWVSKKQYWCKYCDIFIRDDAPSRKQHETGLKHQGNKERFIRDLYKGGEKAKRDRATAAAEMAAIEASAAAAYAHDTLSGAPSTSKLSLLQTLNAASASKRPVRDSKPKDQFANYSTAEQLGLIDPETEKSSYEIEQELGGRAGEAGKWETVTIEPTGLNSEALPGTGTGVKRKFGLGGAAEDEEKEGESWKFDHKGKRPIKEDIYDDDWDPKALKSLKVKVKEERKFDDQPNKESNGNGEVEGGLKREGWSGKIELKPVKSEEREGMKYVPGGGWVKVEEGEDQTAGNGDGVKEGLDVKPDLNQLDLPPASTTENKEPLIPSGDPITETTAAPSASSMFKKRRPPPSSRKK